MKKQILYIFISILFSSTLLSQNQMTTQQDGAWDNAAVWNPAEVPDANDTVIIASGDTITMNGNRTVAKLVIQSNAMLDGSGTDSLAVTGDITVNGDITGVQGILLSGNSTMVEGTGTMDSDTKLYISGNKIIGSGSDLTVSSSFQYLGDDTLTSYGTITIESGLIGNSNNSLWVNEDQSRLNISGELFAATGTLNASTDYNCIDYTGTAQNVKDPVNSTYHRLVFSGSGNPTLQNDVYINGNFRIDCDTLKCNNDTIFFQGDGYAIYGDGVIDDYAAFLFTGSKIVEDWTSDLRITGSIIFTGNDTIYNEGTITIGGSIIGNSNSSYWLNEANSRLNIHDSLFVENGSLIASSNSNTVDYTGTSQQIKTPLTSYHDLTISGSGNHQITGNVDIDGDITLSADTLTLNDYDILLGDDWFSSSLLIPGTGTITFDGNGLQFISNNSGEQFYNLVINKSGGYVNTDDHITVSDTLVLSGTNIVSTDTVQLGTDAANPGTLLYSSGWINGKLERWITNTASEYYFPVGDNVNFRPLMATFNTLPSTGSVVAQFVQEAFDTSGIASLTENGYCFTPTAYNYSINQETRILSRPDSMSDWTLDGSHQNAENDMVKRSSLSSIGAQYIIADTISCSYDPGLPDMPTAHDTSICGEDSITLKVSGSTGNYYWYNDPVSEDVITMSDSFTTPYMNEKDTLNYYISAFDTGSSNNSVTFDGIDDYVAIDHYYNGTDYNAVTVETWIKTADGSDQIIASFDRNEFWRLEIGGSGAGTGQIGWDVQTSDGTEDFGGTYRVDSNKWVHIAAVFDNGEMIIYVNGEVDASQTVTGTTFGISQASYGFLGVGSEASSFNDNTGPDDYFNGQMDEFRIWDTARSQAEIQANMNKGLTGKEDHLLIYYDMRKERGSSKLVDLALPAQDAYMQNMDTASKGYWIFENRNGLSSGDYDIRLDANDYNSSSWSSSGPAISGGTSLESHRETLTAIADTIPVNFIDNNNTGCGSDSVYLDATRQYISYLWSDASTNDTLIVDASGFYWCEVTDDNSCTGRDTIEVSIIPPIITRDSAICGSGSVALGISGGTGMYRWYDTYPDGILLDVDSIYQTPVLTDTTTYYVVSYDTTASNTDVLEFDGSDDYIAIDHFYNGSDYKAVTVEAWIKTTDGGSHMIASFDRNEYWRLEINGSGGGTGQIGWDIYTNDGQIDFGSTSRVDDGEWHHIAAVYDTGNVLIYIDGVLDASTTKGTAFGIGNVSYGFVGIGSEASVFNGSTNGGTFNGRMNEFRVWEKPLTQAEIRYYKDMSLSGNEDGLVVYYKMNEGAGNDTLFDYSLNNRFGVFQNMDINNAWKTDTLVLSETWCEGKVDSATAYIYPIPLVELGIDTCASDSLQLDAGSAGISYEWQDGSTNRYYLADTTGTYYVTRNDGGPCDGSDTNNVTIVYKPTGYDTSRCGNGIVTLRASGKSDEFSWYDTAIGGIRLGTGAYYTTDTLTDTTTYYIAAFDTNGCNLDTLALDFDGSDDYVALNMAYTTAGEITTLTFEAWIKTNFSGGGQSSNWAFIDFDRSDYYDVYAHGDGRLSFSTTDNSGSTDDMYSDSLVNDGEWHHIAAVYDGTDKLLYLDGEEIDRVVNAHGGNPLGTGDTRYGFIGSGSEATSFDGGRNNVYYQGALDEIRIWNTVRTPDEISEYSSQYVDESDNDLIAYFRMDDGAGSDTLTDHSGNNNWGVLRNMDNTTDWIKSDYDLICSSCESFRDTAIAYVNPIPPVDLGTDTCSSDSVILDAGPGMNTYEWRDGSANQIFTADTHGIYWVRVNDGGPCDGYDTIAVTIPYKPYINDTTHCGSDTISIIAPTNSLSYHWYDSASGGNLVGSGDTLTLLYTNTTSYYLASYRPDTTQYAINFDENDDYIAIQDYHYTGGTDYSEVTVEMWYRSTSNAGQMLLAYDYSEYWRLMTGGFADNGEVGWGVNSNDGRFHIESTTLVDDGVWHHIAATYDSGKAYIYIDGMIEDSNTVGTAFGSTLDRYGFIGRNSEADTYNGSSSSLPVDGDITELRIWSVARTKNQIQNYMYHCLTGTESGLEVYYRMDDGVGSSQITDHANNNHGTLFDMDPSTDWINEGPGVECFTCESIRDTVHVTILEVPGANVNPSAGFDTICQGDEVQLEVAFTSGASPYDLYYSDGNTADTIYAIQNDTTYFPVMQPVWTSGKSDTTFYYIEKIIDSNHCEEVNLDTTDVEIFKLPETGNNYYIEPGFNE